MELISHNKIELQLLFGFITSVCQPIHYIWLKEINKFCSKIETLLTFPVYKYLPRKYFYDTSHILDSYLMHIFGAVNTK